MKSLLCLSTLLFSGVFAHADLIVEQSLESQFMNGPLVMKLKGEKARIEMPSPIGGQSITIVDTTASKMTTLMPAQKMAMEIDLKQARKQAEEAIKTGGIDSATKPVATGQKQKIGEWNAEEYTVTTTGDRGMTMHLWVTNDIPKGKEYQEQIGKFTKAFAQGGPDMGSLKLPGLVVKSEVEGAMGKITSTVKSLREEPVADSDFAIPTDYQKMPAPTAGGLK